MVQFLSPLAALSPIHFVGSDKIAVSVEHLRLLTYIGYFVVIGTGIAVTRASGAVPDPDSTVLTATFGFNNICINFDLPPATFVCPVVWAGVLVPYMGYCFFFTVLARAQHSSGALSRRAFLAVATAKAFEAATAIGFSLIFAVAPAEEGMSDPDWKKLLTIHTVPWLVFQLGFVSLAISASVHGVCSGYFARIGLSSKLFLRGLPAYCASLVVVTAIKHVLCIYALSAAPWTPPKAFAVVFEAADRAWLVLGLVVPFGKTLYCVFRDPSRVVWLSLSVGMEQSCQSEATPGDRAEAGAVPCTGSGAPQQPGSPQVEHV